jgi:hypothetical protein
LAFEEFFKLVTYFSKSVAVTSGTEVVLELVGVLELSELLAGVTLLLEEVEDPQEVKASKENTINRPKAFVFCFMKRRSFLFEINCPLLYEKIASL